MQYGLLARHGSVDRKAYTADKDQCLSEKGAQEVEEVAARLLEHIHLLPSDKSIAIAEMDCSGYTHANETARIYYIYRNFARARLGAED